MVATTSPNRVSELARPMTAWPSSSPFSLLRNDLDQLFDSFWRRNGWPSIESPTSLFPSIDLSETNAGYRVMADLPGIKREDVTVAAEGDALVVSGSRTEKTTEDGSSFLCRECVTGEFRRVIGLPEDADLARATASMTNGVLTVSVPKSSTAASRRLVIPIGETSGSTSSSSGTGSSTRSGRNL